uniref:Uncharacterized protein n=1 Tax=Anguilla anguilla TaxID=7936 RepID=A0A0E9V278_ANGAN
MTLTGGQGQSGTAFRQGGPGEAGFSWHGVPIACSLRNIPLHIPIGTCWVPRRL